MRVPRQHSNATQRVVSVSADDSAAARGDAAPSVSYCSFRCAPFSHFRCVLWLVESRGSRRRVETTVCSCAHVYPYIDWIEMNDSEDRERPARMTQHARTIADGWSFASKRRSSEWRSVFVRSLLSFSQCTQYCVLLTWERVRPFENHSASHTRKGESLSQHFVPVYVLYMYIYSALPIASAEHMAFPFFVSVSFMAATSPHCLCKMYTSIPLDVREYSVDCSILLSWRLYTSLVPKDIPVCIPLYCRVHYTHALTLTLDP